MEVREVDVKRREDVYREVVSCMGPPDATVLVSIGVSEQFPMERVDGALQKVAELGIQVLLVK